MEAYLTGKATELIADKKSNGSIPDWKSSESIHDRKVMEVYLTGK